MEKEDDELLDQTSSQTESSLKQSDDIANGMERSTPPKLKENEENLSSLQGQETKEAQFSSSSLKFANNGSEYTTSEGNSRSKLFDHDHVHRHRTKRYGDSLQIIHTIHIRFQRAVDYRTHRLEHKSSKYDWTVSRNIREMSKCMRAQTKPHICDPFNPISMKEFLSNFKVVCDTSGIHKRAAMWLFHFFMKESASFALHTRLVSKELGKK